MSVTGEQKGPASTEEKKQQPIDDEMINQLTQEATPLPKKAMTLDAPVAKEKQLEPVNKQQILPYKKNYDRFKKGMERIQNHCAAQLIKPVNKEPMNGLMQSQDLAKPMENYDQFKTIRKHGIHNFMVTNEFACEKTGTLNTLIPSSVHIQPIRKRIQLTIENCRELFTNAEFDVYSSSIELIGFEWWLAAKMKEKGFLALYLHAIPPDGFKGNYRIEVDQRFSILNASLADKDLIVEEIGQVYSINEENHTGWGFSEISKLEDLLDPNEKFLTPEGDLEICVDFTIKSATLNHLT